MPFRGPSSQNIRAGHPYEAGGPVPVSAADVAAGADALTVQADTSPLTTDAGGAWDALAVVVTTPAADAGAGTDTLAVQADTSPLTADQAGAADQLAVAVASPAADLGAVADALAVTAASSPADAAAGAEQLSVTAVSSAADTGAALDSVAVTAADPAADTAGALDFLGVGIAVQAADAGAAAEALAVTTGKLFSDTAGASDSLAVTASVPVADAAGASDQAYNATPRQGDLGGAAESVTVTVSTPAADTAGASDALAVTSISNSLGDAGAAADQLAVTAAAPAADVAGASDSLAIGGGSNPIDQAGAAESVSVTAAAPAADTAGAAESLAVQSAGLTADTAGAADSLAVSAVSGSADTGAGADSIAVHAADPSADTAGASESLTVSASVPLAERAAAADTAYNPAPAPADAAAASDAIAVAGTVPSADTGAAADSITVTAAEPAADVAGARDAMVIGPVNISMNDRAAGVDAGAGANSGSSGSLGGPLPYGVTTTYNAPGYPGGPSGAASITPASAGNGWEVYVRSAGDYTTLLAVIPNSMLLNFQFVRQLDDIGSGTVILSQDDPWWRETVLPGGLATETLLDEECLWQFYKDGTCRHEFLGETVTEQLVDGSEQRQVTITGPGTLAALKWAMVAPQGFPDIVLKLDGILDSFDEVDGTGASVVDTNIWTTLSPAGHVYITPIANIYSYPGGTGYNLGTLFPSGSMTVEASPSTTYLGASPYDATDTLISAQVTPIGVSSSSTDSADSSAYGSGLNGSELTQFYIQSNYNSQNYAMIGLSATAFYGQFGSGGSVQTKVFPAYDSSSHAYWMITEQAGTGGGPGTFYFWTSADGQSWTQQWSVVHSWDATQVTFYVTAYYSVDKTESVVLTDLNSNVTTPSYQGSIYLGLPLMAVWLDQFNAAQDRGTVPFITSNVSAGEDSYGRAWTDTQNVQATNGTDLYTLLQSGCSVVNADYVMNPGFQLQVGQPATGQVALGVDRSGYIILREGYDTAAKQRVRARDQIQTLIGGENSDGHEIAAYTTTYINKWGQREGWFQAAVQVDPTSMAYATAAVLAENETEVLSWTFTIVPNIPGKTIFDNFDVGDWLGIERPDFSATDTVRVTAIAVSVDNSGTESHELTFVSYMQWLADQLQYISNKLGGTFVNSQGTSPVAPSKYGTGQVPTYFTPAATLQGLSDVATNSAASTQTNAPLVYNSATGQYQAAGSTDPVTGQTVNATVASAAGSATLSDTSVTVVTGTGSTVIGLQGDGSVTTVDSGGAALAVPDAPTVTALVQALQISWDGHLAAASPPSNFKCVQVYLGSSSGFIPSSASLVGTLTAASSLTVSGLTGGNTYYVKLASVNTSGAVSAATSGVAGTAQQMPTSALTGQMPASLIGNTAGSALNPNAYFNGGSLSGWTVTNGTVSVGAPPAGAPGGAQYAALVTATSANCLLNGSSAPFPVTPGQPYAMTSWVYNPSGSSITVAVGFSWTSGTATVTVGPNTWVPVTAVETCPSGVTSAYQVIGPVTSGKALWVLGAVAAGQLPGQLVAANSIAANQIAAQAITAAQIAANTITASQIAANTVTAAQIAASTITAAQIAASTITASQIAANTITASQIQAATLTATQIAAGTVIAGVVNGTIITGATFVATGTSGEFLAYSGTPGSGNLIMSFAASAGTDSYSNAYSAGFWVYGANGSAVGMVPAGSNTALALSPSSGATPTAVAGQTLVYGSSSGTMQIVDGVDGQTYGTARRSLVLGSAANITSTSWGTFFQSTLAANAAQRDYRIRGQLICVAGGSTGTFNFMWLQPSGGGGLISFTWFEGANSWTAGAVASSTRATAVPTMSSGTNYLCLVEGVVTVPAGTSGQFQVQAAQNGSSWQVAATSVIDIEPI